MPPEPSHLVAPPTAAPAVRPPPAQAERGEREAIEEFLERLPKAEAEVIALAYFGRLTPVEIAMQLGLSEERVDGRMRLGLRRLHRAVDARR